MTCEYDIKDEWYFTKKDTSKQCGDKWVAALRSGVIPQTTDTLYTQEGGMCCLGVLAELATKRFGVDWENRSTGYQADTEMAMRGSSCHIEDSALQILVGLDGSCGEWPEGFRSAEVCEIYVDDDETEECLVTDHYTSLAEVNDGGGDFHQIAQLIDEIRGA